MAGGVGILIGCSLNRTSLVPLQDPLDVLLFDFNQLGI